MESLLDKVRIAQTAAQIYHTQVEHLVSVAEIAQINEVTVLSGEYGIAVLEVAVNGGIGIGCIGYELAQEVFLACGKERILGQKAVVSVLDALKLCGIHITS